MGFFSLSASSQYFFYLKNICITNKCVGVFFVKLKVKCNVENTLNKMFETICKNGAKYQTKIKNICE